MNCQYCNRECKNSNSLRNHERLCKSNPNKQTVDMSAAREASGKQHEVPERKEKDEIKDQLLIENGWTVFRIKWFNPRTQRGKDNLYPQIEEFKKLISS